MKTVKHTELGQHLFTRSLICLMVLTLLFTAGCTAKTDEIVGTQYEIKNYSITYGNGEKTTFEYFGQDTDENSVFELASNGKLVAAYIALKLVDEGKIGLDNPVAPLLPQDLLTNDDRLQEITLRQLLCHTAGFSPSFEFGVDKKLYTDPGQTFRYSGVGYIYLQSVIESVSGMNMEQLADHYVFEPLKMVNSTFQRINTVTPCLHLSNALLYALAGFVVTFAAALLLMAAVGFGTKFRFYTFHTGFAISFILAGIGNALFLLFVFVSKVLVLFVILFAFMGMVMWTLRKRGKLFYVCVPIITVLTLLIGVAVPTSVPVTNDLIAKKPNCAYTLKSSSSDMAAFCQMLLAEYHNEDSSVRKMFSPAVVIDDENAWGLGMAIETDGTNKVCWHSGINPGFQSLLAVDPVGKRFMVVLTNSDDGLAFAREKANSFLNFKMKWEIKR